MRRNIILAAAGLTLLFSSCKEDYLEVNPTNAVSEADVFKTSNNAWGAINGMHRAMYFQWGNSDQAGQGGMMIHMDYMGEDLIFTTSNQWFIQTYRWQMHRTANASSLEWAYYLYYRLIGNANMIIGNIDGAAGPAADKNAVKGQALAYRAWAHHQLVQLFAQRYVPGTANDQLGVPLLTMTTTEGQPRATVEEVYAQINQDLDEAITLLEGYNRTLRAAATAKSHINANVARGLKARVALTQGRWADAARFAAEARQGFSLMSNAQYQEGFNDVNNPEWMWGSDQADDQQTFFHSFFAFMSANFNSTNIRTAPKVINSELYEMIPGTDVRSKMWDPTGATIPAPPGGRKLPYGTKKFLAKGASSSVGDVVYMRAAEMYLIEAEAYARLGRTVNAVTALSTLLRNRNPAYVATTLTGAALVDEIMIQRRIELWGEGFRFLDLKRTNSPLDRRGLNHNEAFATPDAMFIPANSNLWQFLIPQSEINANKAIQAQND